jgi:hypothetical protein
MEAREESKNIDAVSDVIARYNNLTEEDKKKVIERIVWQQAIHPYIAEEAATRTEHGAKAFASFRKDVCHRANESVDLLMDNLCGDDEKLRDEIVKTFIENYRRVVNNAKKRICGANHQYSDWKTLIGERPQYNLDGEEEYTCNGTYYERVCDYCGTKQTAYSETEKLLIEKRTQEEIEFSKFYKKLTKEIINKSNEEN